MDVKNIWKMFYKKFWWTCSLWVLTFCNMDNFNVENKYDVYIREYWMKKFRESFWEHTIKIINFEKKKRISLPDKQQESYKNTKIWCTFLKHLSINALVMKITTKMVNAGVLHIAYVIWNMVYQKKPMWFSTMYLTMVINL